MLITSQIRRRSLRLFVISHTTKRSKPRETFGGFHRQGRRLRCARSNPHGKGVLGSCFFVFFARRGVQSYKSAIRGAFLLVHETPSGKTDMAMENQHFQWLKTSWEGPFSSARGTTPKVSKNQQYLRIFQHTPGTYPRPESPTVYESEFFLFGGERECLGYALR